VHPSGSHEESCAKGADTAAPGEIIERLSGAAAASIRARRRLPGLMRRIRISVEPREGVRERWSLPHAMDVIYTRDTWMHRWAGVL
jgi:hypothetical protein